MTENISVIIVTYFTTNVLFDCIKSCRNMNGIEEIVVVNNGNPPVDLAKLKDLDKKGVIKLIDGNGNIGFGKACNIGSKASKGKYQLFINPDCYTDNVDFAIKLRDALENHPEYWFATSLILNSDSTIQKTCRRNLMTPLNAISQSLGLKRFGVEEMNRDVSEIENLPEVSDLEVFSGALFFCEREKYERVGGFSEEYFLHVEDMDICRKIHNEGGKICFVKSVSIHHALSTSLVANKFLELHKAKGFIIYFRKYYWLCRMPIISQLLSAAIWLRYYIKTR